MDLAGILSAVLADIERQEGTNIYNLGETLGFGPTGPRRFAK